MNSTKCFTLLTAIALGVPAAVTAAEVGDKPMVWSHYVPWHLPENGAITVPRYINYPILRGPLDRLSAFQKEFRMAKEQGIDGFFPDLVARKNGHAAFIDTVGEMLKAAEGMDFYIAPCLDVKTDVKNQIADLKYILDKNASHPNYPKVNGKPVIATYIWSSWTPEEWRAIREGLKKEGHDIYLIANLSSGFQKKNPEKIREYAKYFDMAYSFGESGLDGQPLKFNLDLIADCAKESRRDLCGSLAPGYYGAWLNGRNDFYQPHLGFDQLHETFLAMKPGREKWMHFSTWNDHDETSILPMLYTGGNRRITRAYSLAFKKLTPPREIQLAAAYHRETQPGSVIRLELMTLPSSSETEKVSVSGKLLDMDGNTVYSLPPKTMNTKVFDRMEYLIPSAELAGSPVLTPVIEVRHGNTKESRTFQPILLKSGGLFNAVTVKEAFHDIAPDFSNSLKISQTGEVLEARIQFDAPQKVKHATLFRNDLPLADFSAQSPAKPLMNLLADFSGNLSEFQISLPEGGEFIRGGRMFGTANDPKFQFSAKKIVSKSNLTWTQSGFLLTVSPSDKLKISPAGAEPVVITAGELADRSFVSVGALKLIMVPSSPTVLNAPPLDLAKGELSFQILSRTKHPDDLFFVRYELENGNVGYSRMVLPFETRKPFRANLLNTSTTLETSSNASGYKFRHEFLTPPEKVPFMTPSVTENSIHPAAVRSNRWTFERGGFDELGEQPIRINAYRWTLPEKIIAENLGQNGQTALKFDGENRLRMPLRSSPVGAFTLDFYINPTAGRQKTQSVIHREGWNNTVAMNLSKDGKIELIRSGNEKQPVEKLSSNRAIPSGKWSRLRICYNEKELKLFIDGKLDASRPVVPARSYGNSAWFIGGGSKELDGYTGLIDDVTLCGQAFLPGDPGYPAESTLKPLPEIASIFGKTALRTTPFKAEWTSAAFELIEPRAKARAVTTPEGGITLLAGPGASHRGGTVTLSNFSLKDGEELNIPLLRYLRKDPCSGWTALEVVVKNDRGTCYSFNMGTPGRFMLLLGNLNIIHQEASYFAEA